MKSRACVVVPTYNHGGTVRKVVEEIFEYSDSVMVVDDGSTDDTRDKLRDLPIIYICRDKNCGKGAAIGLAALEAEKRGFTHIITIDADCQHKPGDLPKFIRELENHPNAIIIGKRDFSVPNVPASSKFGRSFSGFWMFVQTGARISDMQSGYRAYPLALFRAVKCMGKRYSFEIEVLVKAAWAGFEIREIAIVAWYPPAPERVSHFRAFMDNFRISMLNTRLTIRALMPIPFRRSALAVEGRLGLTRPVHTFERLSRFSSPRQLARSAAWSLLISTIPVIGLNTILLLFAISWKRLDRLCALVMVPLTWPPFVPALCVLAGYRMVRGEWLTEFNLQTLGHEAGYRFLDWLAGSVVVAPLLAIAGYGTVYFFSRYLLSRK